jgi:nucleoside-diphosphate-sugar epimerase
MASLKNILLIGSTGTIGSAIRKGLVARKSAFDKVGVLTGSASLADPKRRRHSNLSELRGLRSSLQNWMTRLVL